MTMGESVGKPCVQVLDEVIGALVDLRQKLDGDSILEHVWASDGQIKSDLFFRSKSEFDDGCKSLRALKDVDTVLAPLYRPIRKKILVLKDVDVVGQPTTFPQILGRSLAMTMDESVRKSCVHVVDEVIEALDDLRLNLDGDSILEDVWASDGSIKSDLFFRSNSEFDNGYKSLQTLRDLDNVLALLYRPISKKISELKNALLCPAFHHGLASIPNETFMLIMDFLAASCTEYAERMKLIKDLSSVCKRFRDGVVDTLSFWIYWDSRYCLDDGFQHRLARTREASLFVDIDARCAETNVEKILTRILPHKNRWHQLCITFLGRFKKFTTALPTADFPSVRSLEVLRIVPDLGLDLEEPFLAKWTFPNVCSVELDAIIPPPGVFSKVTWLRLRDNYVDLTLTRLLSTMPALLTLHLDVPSILPSQTTESYTVELPSVITFKIESILRCTTCFKDVGQFTRALRLPNVEHYTLGLSFRAKEGEAWVSEIFPEGIPLCAVKDFHLSVMSRFPAPITLFFDGFSSRFPNIRSLHVERLRYESGSLGDGRFHLAETFDTLEGCLPLLRSLVVFELDDDWSMFLKWFKNLREKGGMIEHLSVSEMVGNIDLGLFKRDNIDVDLLPREPTRSPSVDGS